MCSNENAKPAMKTKKKKIVGYFCFFQAECQQFYTSDQAFELPFAFNQIIYVISIAFHVLLIFDHYYGLLRCISRPRVAIDICVVLYLNHSHIHNFLSIVLLNLILNNFTCYILLPNNNNKFHLCN